MADSEAVRSRAFPALLAMFGLLALGSLLPHGRRRQPQPGDGCDDDDLREAERLIERQAKEMDYLDRPDEETIRAEAEAREEERAIALAEAKAAGLDLERLDKVAAEQEAKRKQRSEAADRRAIDASHETARRLAQMLPARPFPLEPETELIEEVTFIRSFAGQGAVVESRIVPGDNFARYQLRNARIDQLSGLVASGTGRLSFFTLWRNPRARLMRVAVDATVQLGLRLVVEAAGAGLPLGLIGFGNSARATVRLRTTVHALPGSGVRAIVADRVIGGAQVRSGAFGKDERKVINFAEVLSGTATLVPARGRIMIEISLLTEWAADFGDIRVDAEGGSFGMRVPFLSLTTS